jgi:hypothetical protein
MKEFFFSNFIKLFLVECNIPVTVTYQRFQSGVDFEGEFSKYYNPTYFFLRIFNQKESYDEMHENIKLRINSKRISIHFLFYLVSITIVLIQLKIIFLNRDNFVQQNLRMIPVGIERELYDLLVRSLIKLKISYLLIILGNEKAQLIFVDSGDMCEINLHSIQPLNSQFSDRPAQALACTLAQVSLIQLVSLLLFSFSIRFYH